MKEFLNKMHYGLFRLLLDIYEKCNPKNNNWQSSKRQQNFDNSIFYDYVISKTHHIFGYNYSGYFSFFSFILLGIKDVFFDIDNKIVTLLLMGLPILVGYIPAYKAVLSNDVYLNYYKKFEKKDARWQRKCKWMAVAFCIGGFLTMILGLFAYSFIVEYMKS